MSHLAQLALACLVLSGSIAEAKKRKPKPVTIEMDDDYVGRPDDGGGDDNHDDVATPERVGAREELDELDQIDEAPVKLRAKAPELREWTFAIGPYVWASSVQADISLGNSGQSVGTGIDFVDIKRHAKFGIELMSEARYGRFSLTGDFLYGVVAIDGARDVGPVMVAVDGSASSLLFDGVAGYLLAGGDRAVLSIEARGGVRYQRTAVNASIGLDGSHVASPGMNDTAADAIAGARVALRPFHRFAVAGAFDTRVFGMSSQTWSGSVDGSYQFGKRVLVSLGWRTLMTDRSNVSLTMFGPRAAVQLLF